MSAMAQAWTPPRYPHPYINPGVCPGCGRCTVCGKVGCKPQKNKWRPSAPQKVYRDENLGNKVQQAVDFINS